MIGIARQRDLENLILPEVAWWESLSVSLGLDDAAALLNGNELVRLYASHLFDRAAGPPDFNLVYFRNRPQAEMLPKVAL